METDKNGTCNDVVLTVNSSSPDKSYMIELSCDSEKQCLKVNLSFQGEITIQNLVTPHEAIFVKIEKLFGLADGVSEDDVVEVDKNHSEYDATEQQDNSFQSEKSVVDYELSQQIL
jgi:hypothetical protein